MKLKALVIDDSRVMRNMVMQSLNKTGPARTLGNLGRLAPGRSAPYIGLGDDAPNDPRSPSHGQEPARRLG